MSNKELTGRVALITGAAQGIGRSIAQALSSSGASIACCDLLAAEQVAPLTLESPTAYFSCDVGDQDQVSKTMEDVIERFDRLDILINNAGIAIDGLLMRTKSEDWSKVLRVNLTGAFNCVKAAAKFLLKSKSQGRVINMASVVGEQGNVGQVAYSASKSALLGMTKTMAREFASRGVTVNAVSPGFIETQMTQDHVQGERRQKLLEAIPLSRIGSPEDVAATVLFLCSDGASYITGQVIRVNGGLYM